MSKKATKTKYYENKLFYAYLTIYSANLLFGVRYKICVNCTNSFYSIIQGLGIITGKEKQGEGPIVFFFLIKCQGIIKYNDIIKIECYMSERFKKTFINYYVRFVRYTYCEKYRGEYIKYI